ncbi:MAG TPA: hypothetical protein VFW38_01395 [Solirubrobacteraceae bacterium]|nr:hypothetical protein [Solirubrobacteraceae bacterium]
MRLTRLATIVVALVLAGGSIAAAVGTLTRRPAVDGPAQAETSHPRAPDHLQGPASQTIAAYTARFTWRDAGKRVVGFRCSLDGGPFTRCHSGVLYRSLANGRHTFALVAVDRHGRRSHLARGKAAVARPSWVWTILPAESLSMIGDLDGGLYPGAPASPIDLALSNPHGFALQVQTASVTIEAVRAPNSTASLPCAPSDFAVSGYRGAGFKAPPGSSTLRQDRVPVSQWPAITMVNRPHDQDGCMGATVLLAYHGLAGRLSGGG